MWMSNPLIRMNFITENNGVYLVKIKNNGIESKNECKNIYGEGPQKKKNIYIKKHIHKSIHLI